MKRQYNQKRVVKSTSPDVSRVKPRNNSTKINLLDISSDSNESLLVSRNELVESQTGLKAKPIRKSTTYAKVVEHSCWGDKNVLDKEGDKNTGHVQQNLRNQGVHVLERNFLSHTEFPDVKSAHVIENAEQTEKPKTGPRIEKSGLSAKNVRTFKPFDSTKAPTIFQNVNANSQNQEQYNAEMTKGTQFYPQQVPSLYEYIQPHTFTQQPPSSNYVPQSFAYPPPENNYIPHNYEQHFNIHNARVPTRSTATAITPNGTKIFIPLDDRKYEIKRGNHDLYEMPDFCDLYTLSSEGEFESQIQFTNSPRPVDNFGSLSDESCESSYAGSYSESNSEQEAEADVSETTDIYVTDDIKAMSTNNNTDNYNARYTEKDEQEDKNINDNLKYGKQGTFVNTFEFQNTLSKDNELESDTLAFMTEHLAPVQNAECSYSFTENSSSAKRNGQIKDNEKETAPNVKRNQSEFKPVTPADVKFTIKKSHAWKDNRKEKRYKTINKPEECMKGKNDEMNNVCEVIQGTNISDNVSSKSNPTRKQADTTIKTSLIKETAVFDGHLQTQGSNNGYESEYIQCVKNSNNDSVEHNPSSEQVGSITNAANTNEILIVDRDGQVYFATQVVNDGQYQQHYVPESYTRRQNQHPQQFQSPTALNYTHFIHDAYAPPSPGVDYGEVSKSVSGELINLTDNSVPKSQMIDGGINSEQLSSGFDQSIKGERTEERVKDSTQQTDQSFEEIQINVSENAPVANAGLSHETLPQTGFHPRCTYTVNEAPLHIPKDHGKLFTSYNEDCVYIDPESGMSFPALHLSDDYLITLILRKGIFLEIAADKSLRLVNHDKKLVVAINGSGDKVCIIHPAARIYQSGTSVHAELYLGRRAQMTNELIMFGNKLNTYKFDHIVVTKIMEEPKFRDLSQDDSVTFLAAKDGVNMNNLKQRMEEVMYHSHFRKLDTRGCTVTIHGTKVVQNEKGEVSVYSGPIKFIRMDPDKLILRAKTQNIEIDIETNWNVKITRGSHALNASYLGFIVSNGKIKASLNSDNKLQTFSIPDHRFFMRGQPVSQRQQFVPKGQMCRASHQKE